MDKQTRIKLGYEKSITAQLHEELFKTTSEHRYYQLGVASGLYSVYTMLNHLIHKGYETAPISDLMKVIVESVNFESEEYKNIKDMLDRMIENDKEDL